MKRYIPAWDDNWTGKEIEPGKVSHIEITIDGVSVEMDLDKSTPMFQTLGRLHAKGEEIGKGTVTPIKSAPSAVRKAPKKAPAKKAPTKKATGKTPTFQEAVG